MEIVRACHAGGEATMTGGPLRFCEIHWLASTLVSGPTFIHLLHEAPAITAWAMSQENVEIVRRLSEEWFAGLERGDPGTPFSASSRPTRWVSARSVRLR
jgi:hypothetical protein